MCRIADVDMPYETLRYGACLGALFDKLFFRENGRLRISNAFVR